MGNRAFERKHKEDRPVLAICYDFDKTLSPDDMQAQGYIQSVEYDVKAFWTESNELAQNNDMDQNLAYMYKMVEEAEGHFVFNREKLAEYGANVKLFPGVADWFERIRAYGAEQNVIVEHYIISSGLKEMIEGTEVAKKGAFEKIYASSFYFNKRGVAKWPAQVVNYTNKTQFLFRIEKGVLDVNDPGVNDYFAPEDLRVPFRNMVYIGDSDTDVPCMKLVNSYGGHSIGVYNPETGDKQKVFKMMKDNRIKYFAPADYSEGTELDRLIKAIIDRTAANEILESRHFEYKKETLDEVKRDRRDEDEQKKDSLIAELKGSSSFSFTHLVIKQLSQYSEWSSEQRESLFDALVHNFQLYWIIGDEDVHTFYSKLLEGYESSSENAQKVRERLLQHSES